ncbi:hypothetical protein ACOMHN_043773 [Nucella lapillus]
MELVGLLLFLLLDEDVLLYDAAVHPPDFKRTNPPPIHQKSVEPAGRTTSGINGSRQSEWSNSGDPLDRPGGTNIYPFTSSLSTSVA